MTFLFFVRNFFILFIFFFIITSESFSFNIASRQSYTFIKLIPPDSLKLNDGTDPSQPVSRIDIQNTFYWDWLEYKEDRYYNVSQLNSGKIFYRGKLYMLLKIPLVTTNMTFENQFGLGDISFDIQYSTNNKNKLNIITGLEFIFPTESSNETGLGKFITAPYTGFINYFKSGYYGLIITEYFSYAGQENRNVINELSINPIFKINLGKNWYTIFTSDIVYTFKTGRLFIPYTQELGKLFSENFVASIKAGVHLKNDNKYDVLSELKFSFIL